MTNRREFLHLGVAALSLPIAARAGMPADVFGQDDVLGAPRMPLYKTLFDERFAACSAFAEEMKRRALATHAIRGDITGVWYSDLYFVWKEGRSRQGSAAIAGMTAPGPIFCLEMLARDAGMRVVLRVDHRQATQGRIEHHFAGPEELLARATDLQASAGRWPERMAGLVANFPLEDAGSTTARFSGSAFDGRQSTEHLVTWVIAPARRS